MQISAFNQEGILTLNKKTKSEIVIMLHEIYFKPVKGNPSLAKGISTKNHKKG